MYTRVYINIYIYIIQTRILLNQFKNIYKTKQDKDFITLLVCQCFEASPFVKTRIYLYLYIYIYIYIYIATHVCV